MEGRNITKELHSLMETSTFPSTSTSTSTTTSSTSTSTTNLVCTSFESGPVVSGQLVDETSLEYAHDCDVSRDGKHAYVVGAVADSLAVINVTDVSNPLEVGSIVGNSDIDGPKGVAISPTDDDLVFVTATVSNSVAVINVSNVSHPRIIGRVENSTYLGGARGIDVSADGQYVYIASQTSHTFAVVNVSDPSTPTIVGGITGDPMQGADDVAVSTSGKYVYVACRQSDALVIVNVQDPTNVGVVGVYQSSDELDHPVAVQVVPNSPYIVICASNSKALVVIDVATDPTSPAFVASITWPTSYGITGVMMSPDGRYAMVSTPYNFYVVDMETPAHPTEIGNITGDASLNGVVGMSMSPDGGIVLAAAMNSNALTLISWGNCS